MNNRNEMIASVNDAGKYLEEMKKNAQKHGIKLYFVAGEAPFISQMVGGIYIDSVRSPQDADNLLHYWARMNRQIRDYLGVSEAEWNQAIHEADQDLKLEGY